MTGVPFARSAAVRTARALPFGALAVLATALLPVAISTSSRPAWADAPPVVDVRGRGGRALEGVLVWRHEGDTWRALGKTGADGTFALPAQAVKEAWDIAATADPAGPKDAGAGPLPGRRVSAGRMPLAIDCGADVTIEVVEADSGQALPGFRWRWSTKGGETPWVAAGETAPLLVGRDGVPYETLEVEAPKGSEETVWLRDLPSEVKRGWRRVSWRGGPELRGVVALRRVANLKVRPTNASGAPSALVRAAWAYEGGGEPCATAAAAASTEVTLQTPYYRGARLTVVASGRQHGKVAVRLPMEFPLEPIEVKVPLTLEEPIALDGPLGDTLEGGFMGDVYDERDPSGGALDLKVTTSDGRPLAGAEVEATLDDGRSISRTTARGRTGRDGGLLIRDLPLGAYAIVVQHPEALRIRKEVRLERRGVPTTLALQEPKGGEVEVLVVDADGAPLPFAGVTVRGLEGADGGLAPGPTRLDPFTERDGRRTFRRLDAGKATLTAWYGPSTGTATVDVPEGGKAKTRVVVQQKP